MNVNYNSRLSMNTMRGVLSFLCLICGLLRILGPHLIELKSKLQEYWA